MSSNIKVLELTTEWVNIREVLNLPNQTLQITNRGSNKVLLEESDTVPPLGEDVGELLTTFLKGYASMISTYESGYTVYARSTERSSKITVQVV